MMMRDRSRFLLGSLFSSLGLPGFGDSAPAKLQIKYELARPRDYLGEITAPFNPNTLTSSSNVTWRTIPLAATAQQRAYAIHYTASSASPSNLSFDLAIDTHEGEPGGGGGWGGVLSVPNPTALHIFTAPTGVSVLPYTSQIAMLQMVNTELHRPPLCEVWWGHVRLIEGPLTALTQRFTRFLADGTPVRAQLSCTFTDASWTDSSELNSNDVQKTHTVGLGDTLQGIAAREYGDPTLWRAIAEANDIDDPRRLTPGTVLIVPALR